MTELRATVAAPMLKCGYTFRVRHDVADDRGIVQIKAVDIAPLELPIPKDNRLKKIYQHLADRPEDNRTLAEWGKKVGATSRTLARRFRVETGMTFGQWRQQVRILEALKRLAMNEPVTTVAIELGYESQSAFISMFKKALGKTPGQYFSGN